MSITANALQTGSQIIQNYDTTPLVLSGGKYAYATYKNTTGAEVTLAKGTLLGKITVLAGGSTNTLNYLWPHGATNAEGANEPVGVLVNTVTVANGASVTLCYVYGGEVDQAKIVLADSETLATIVSKSLTVDLTPDQTFVYYNRAIREQIIANTQLTLVALSQNTDYDNQ